MREPPRDSGWSVKNLGDAMLATAALDEVERAFVAWRDAEGGEGVPAAVFLRHESEGRLHCDLIAYFSPGAGAVARALGASPCLRPARAGLSLLVGSTHAWPEDAQSP